MAELAIRRPAAAAAHGVVLRPLLLAGIVTALAAAWFTAGWGGETVVRWADDLGTGVAATTGAILSWRTSRGGDPAFRRSWRLIAVGALAWAAGEVVWITVDLGNGAGVSDGLAADVGYLLLPILACAAILGLPTGGGPRARGRWLLDGAIVAVSAYFVLWNSVADRINGAHPSGIRLIANAAFPVVDVALLTALVVASSLAPVGQLRMRLLAVGLALLAVADSGFAYLDATNTYRTGAFCDVAYVAAFAALCAAAALPHGLPARPRRHAIPVRLQLGLPYIPVTVAAGVMLYRVARHQEFGVAAVVLLGTLAALVITRQYLAMLDNDRLVRDLQRQRERLEASTLTDPLTGIGNRVMFADRVQHALQLHARDRRAVAVCWIDLDDFKLTNDRFGHAAGDRVLAEVAGRMAGVLRSGDTIARVGGDEFAVLLEDGGDPMNVGERLHACVGELLHVAGQPMRVTVSVGVAILGPDDDPVTGEELMSRADTAMYAAKALHGQRVRLYEPGMTVPGAEDAALREPLKAAIAAGGIEVHYQPFVAADSGLLSGFEALARWTFDERTIAPARFVALAERLGLATELGDHVLAVAIRQLGQWSRARGDDRLFMSVNLSPDQLLDVGLAGHVARLLRRHGVAPRQLTLEITEGALLSDNPRALLTARALTSLGVTLALDDFGTGYSSLAHLRGFPLSELKIDHSFIADIDVDPQARDFLRAVARLGRDLGLRLVAEGVERASQLEIVRQLGPTLVQGHLFSPSRPGRAFDTLVCDDDARLAPGEGLLNRNNPGILASS